MLNKCILIGRMTKDIEIRHTNSGKAVGTFTIAINNGYGENQTTDFINCVAWEKKAEFIKNWFGKGRTIVIVGRITTRSWEDETGQKKYATEVVVNEVSFAGEKREETTTDSMEDFTPVDNDEDLPWNAGASYETN